MLWLGGWPKYSPVLEEFIVKRRKGRKRNEEIYTKCLARGTNRAAFSVTWLKLGSVKRMLNGEGAVQCEHR